MKINRILCAIIIASLASCSNDDENSKKGQTIVGGPGSGGSGGTVIENTSSLTYTPTTTLKAAATFPMGMIASADKLSGNDANFTTALNKEFNSITAENDMKMGEIFKAANTYDFTKGDAIVNYAKANNMRVHGHALIWHASVPTWLKNYTGTDAQFETLIKDYIKATVTHFALVKNAAGKSVVESWDVVNENFTTDAGAGVFVKRLGADYMQKCFKWAREADATVKLFYNDYSLESQGSKTEQVVNMVKDFKAKSIPIDGIGMQMHVDYKNPSISTINSNLAAIQSTGLLIHFSELDMTVNADKVLQKLTQERAEEQMARYKEIVQLYNKIPVAQKFGITIWGLRDNDSWLLSFLNNQVEFPLLFNDKFQYKIAHKGFVEGLK